MRYDFIVVRVDYPLECGYRMERKQLPDWIYLTVTEDDDSKYLTVYSRLHFDKEVKINPSYSLEFSDVDIIKDLSGKISSMFL